MFRLELPVDIAFNEVVRSFIFVDTTVLPNHVFENYTRMMEFHKSMDVSVVNDLIRAEGQLFTEPNHERATN